MNIKYKDYYSILDVPRSASSDEIHKAYRKLARTYHPDVNKSPGAENRFKEISEAYAVLGDAQKRQQYDSLGSNWRMGQDFTTPPGWEAHTDWTPQDTDSFDFRTFSPDNFSDFFASLFGDFAKVSWGKTSTGRTSRKRDFRARQPDQETDLPINLEEALHGGKRRLILTYSEPGKPESRRTIEVKIPPGIQDGAKIRLKRQGKPSASDLPPSDLILHVRYQPHHFFKVAGHDLHLTLPLAPWEAALGGKIEIPALDGQVRLTMQPGINNGQKLRLNGKGLPKKDGTRGDLIVEINIVIPDTISSQDKELWEKLKKNSNFNPRKW